MFEGEVEWILMGFGIVVYVLFYWVYRIVNIGNEFFIFFVIYLVDVGYDYGLIKEKGFLKIVIEEDGEVKVVDNLCWKE